MATKSKYNKLTIRQIKGSRGIMVGANTEVLLNGKKLAGVRSASFSVNAKGVAEVSLTMLGTAEVEGKVYDHQLGNYGPVALKRTKTQSKSKT